MPEKDVAVIDVFVTSNIIVLVLVIAIILFVVFYQQKLLRQQLAIKEQEADYQQQLLARTIEGQEVAQARMAKDLHDDLGALLSIVKLRLDGLESHEKLRPEIDELKKLLGGGLLSIRQIVNDLLPPILRDFGLLSALEDLTERINRGGSLQVLLEGEFARKQLDSKLELPLYRIVQELLNNTLKHAEASTAWIDLVLDKNQLILEYRDDGKGFDAALLKTNQGFENLESRTRILGGSFEYHANLGKGFRAFFQIPLDPPNALSI